MNPAVIKNIAGKWGPRIELMYFLLKMEIFHCYVSLPGGSKFQSAKHEELVITVEK